MPSSIMIPEDIPFRGYQLKALGSFITTDPEISQSNLFISGYSGTGKTHVLKKFFELNSEHLVYAFLNPVELVSWKPLFQAVARVIQSTLNARDDSASTSMDPLRVEEPYHLVNFVEHTFKTHSTAKGSITFYLVLDGFDSLQDVDFQLLLKFLKINELITQGDLKIIYTVQDPSFLQKYASFSIPKIVFPRYNQTEINKVLQTAKVDDLSNSTVFHEKLNSFDNGTISTEICKNFVYNFINLIVQTFHSYTGNNIFALSDLIDLKWPSYLTYTNENNFFDPIALYKSSLPLFLRTDDGLQDDSLKSVQLSGSKNTDQTYELSTIAKYLLISAYFCSYLEPKYDLSIFSKKSYIKAGRSAYGRRKRAKTNPRHLQPSLFAIERLLAIFQSIFPSDELLSTNEVGSLSSLLDEEVLIRANVEVFQNLAELNSLKLIMTTNIKNIDFLSYKMKWKVNVPWEIIVEIADSINFDISQYFSFVDE
ncbi:hypothetical protein KAFR_0F03460 [Kazachstania africana CBS 2517]|uniref:Uncharacterized protein n=1 Tax=Kazachstania africana (strain ATCC 22294 / BCRC 22015 / CBS 2517 / CECT 1963 / NBRC 1671 / NRRL Y-8276) TaxID=1071382 RepID=H2AX42_KAZAF|nr:hypothetical protein KAFR_0F03460 [Kazachstania africana CBS 2517]CCF58942.1 hypothetical protein KAFR_0F03460 [Kazachstania africana CBS 2517]